MKPDVAFNKTYELGTACQPIIYTTTGFSGGTVYTENCINIAYAFAKRIWLPTGSNYLIYSGISPGLTILLPIKVSEFNKSKSGC